MKKLLLIAALCLSNLSYAESRAQIVSMVRDAAVEFCGGGDHDEKFFQSNGKLYVFYSTSGYKEPYHDAPCSMGSGTYSSHLAEVSRINGRFQVTDVDLLKKINNEYDYVINDRFIEPQGMTVSNGVWIFRNGEFGTDPKTGRNDGNCCADDIYLNKIRLSDMKVLNRTYLGRRARPGY